VALARSGVTATVSSAQGSRYGNLGVDSNLPDVRISIGGPDENTFTAEVFERAGIPADALEPPGVRWVPPDKPLAEVWQPSADLRDARALGVLVVPTDAVQSIVDDLADHVIEVGDGDAGQDSYAGRSVALMNRGLPGFAVDSAGTLHASLMRSCTGWPSGVWIDPPRRTAPDGSNFQLQHWTHEFHYSITSGDGDWRAAGISETSAEYGRPLLPVVVAEAGTRLPNSGSLLSVEPARKVRLTALKAAGNPLTASSAAPADPRTQVALRLVAHHGEPVSAKVDSPLLRLTEPRHADLLEQPGDPATGDIPIDGFDAVTLLARPETDESTVDFRLLGPEAELAQPLYAKYWLHNRGPAPLGGLPVAVHLDPAATRVTVASDRTDGDLHGFLRLTLPDGWSAEPAEVPFGLPPGGHLNTELTIGRPGDVAPGSYPIRARVELAGDDLPESWRQVVEDVAVITVPGADTALLRFTGEPQALRLAPGQRGAISARVASGAHAPIAVEAALVSPWGTWELAGPRAIGAEIPALGEVELTFDLTPPPWTPPGHWWALIKVAGAGKLLYSPAVALEVAR
jgi:hypothetical protein